MSGLSLGGSGGLGSQGNGLRGSSGMNGPVGQQSGLMGGPGGMNGPVGQSASGTALSQIQNQLANGDGSAAGAMYAQAPAGTGAAPQQAQQQQAHVPQQARPQQGMAQFQSPMPKSKVRTKAHDTCWQESGVSALE